LRKQFTVVWISVGSKWRGCFMIKFYFEDREK